MYVSYDGIEKVECRQRLLVTPTSLGLLYGGLPISMINKITPHDLRVAQTHENGLNFYGMCKLVRVMTKDGKHAQYQISAAGPTFVSSLSIWIKM